MNMLNKIPKLIRVILLAIILTTVVSAGGYIVFLLITRFGMDTVFGIISIFILCLFSYIIDTLVVEGEDGNS